MNCYRAVLYLASQVNNKIKNRTKDLWIDKPVVNNDCASSI